MEDSTIVLCQRSRRICDWSDSRCNVLAWDALKVKAQPSLSSSALSKLFLSLSSSCLCFCSSLPSAHNHTARAQNGTQKSPSSYPSAQPGALLYRLVWILFISRPRETGSQIHPSWNQGLLRGLVFRNLQALSSWRGCCWARPKSASLYDRCCRHLTFEGPENATLH